MKTTYIFSGHAQLPTGLDIYESNKYLTVVAEVDMNSGEIINCMVPVYCNLSNDFAESILKGKNLSKDINLIVKEIDERCQILSKRSLMNAIHMLHNRYIMVKDNSPINKRKLD